MSVLIVPRNVDAPIDPMRFFCKLDEVANALLLYDDLIILSFHYLELVNLVPWLGEQAFVNLLRRKELRFALFPWDPAWSLEGRKVRIVAYCTEHGPNIETVAGRIEVLQSLLRRVDLLPEDFSIADETIQTVAECTFVYQDPACYKQFPQSLIDIITGLLSNTPQDRLSSGLGASQGLARILEVSSDGEILVRADLEQNESSTLSENLTPVLNAAKELFCSGLFHTSIVNGSDFFRMCVEAGVAKGTDDPRSRYFTEILDIHKIPMVGTAAYDGRVTGADVLRVRNSKNCKAFRRWLEEATMDCQPQTASIVARYVNDVTEEYPRDTLWFSGIRTLGTGALGTAHPAVGAIAAAADFTLSKWYYKDRWRPSIFVRREYQQTLSQSNNVNGSIPYDLLYYFTRKWKLVTLELHEDWQATAKLSRTPGESSTVSYGTRVEDVDYVRTHIFDILDQSQGATLSFQCYACSTKNRMRIPANKVTEVTCGNCHTIRLERSRT